MKLSVRTRLVWLALVSGLDPIAAFEMPAVEFARRVEMARGRRLS